MFLRNRFVQKLGGGFLEQFAVRTWSRLLFRALGSHKEKDVVKLLRKIQRERKSLLTAFEAYLVYSVARAQTKRPGDFAEVGVYAGASAKTICEVKGGKTLHLYDTFEGLPPTSEKDAGVHRTGQYACSLESVREYLQGYPDVHFHKGLFPESAEGVEETTYAFAHFDVDLYESTMACLDYYYSRMNPGGIMLSHDYSLLDGVKAAFQEFFVDKTEEIIELPTSQCMIVKL
ncbi:MAG: class I SAM-dependent methyltransferase [Planctomycetes bacterium]|nr:class I SAM-dependent methyltransferase [Planctomycetota bacterium]MBL7038893.1 class I SAM-dependent methyltransferase [Pirellulaceae bacterium]